MTISIVQSQQGGGSGISGTLNITLGAGTTAGNCLIVVIGTNASNVVPSAITLGGTGLTNDANKTDAGANAAVSFWSLPNIAGGQTAVAITHAATWSPGVTVLEVSGLATASVFDVATAGGSSSAGSQSSFDSGSTTTGAAAALWLGCCVTFGTSGHTTIGPTGAGTWSAFTNIQQGSFTDVLGADQIVSATGTLQYTGTLSPAAADWVALAVSYAGAGGTTPVPPPLPFSPGKTWRRQFKHPQALPAPAAQTVPVSLADSGTGADSLAVTAAVPLSDSGTGSDALAITQPTGLTDAGTGTDSLAIVQPTGLTDSGTSAEALGIMPGLTDSGQGTDALGITLVTVVPLTDAGSASDQLGIMPGLTDSGTGSDALAVASAVQLSDSGTGTDVFAVTQPTGLTDSGHGTDSLVIVPFTPGSQAPGSATAANGLARSVYAQNSAASVKAANRPAQLVTAGNSI